MRRTTVTVHCQWCDWDWKDTWGVADGSAEQSLAAHEARCKLPDPGKLVSIDADLMRMRAEEQKLKDSIKQLEDAVKEVEREIDHYKRGQSE